MNLYDHEVCITSCVIVMAVGVGTITTMQYLPTFAHYNPGQRKFDPRKSSSELPCQLHHAHSQKRSQDYVGTLALLSAHGPDCFGRDSSSSYRIVEHQGWIGCLVELEISEYFTCV